MTVRLYDNEPYQREFTGDVIVIGNNTAVLNQTCFYSESGGQPGDTGTINGIRVIGTKFAPDKNEILHTLASSDTLSPGQSVTGEIDWDRRYRVMRLHSALHICYLAFVTIHGQHRLRGSDIGVERARLDFEFFEPVDVSPLEDAINDIVRKDLLIERHWSGCGNDRGIWRIEGHEDIPCGGTHPKSTGEVGTVSCKVKRKGKQGQRIYVSLT